MSLQAGWKGVQKEWRSLPEEELNTFTALLAIRNEVNLVRMQPSTLS